LTPPGPLEKHNFSPLAIYFSEATFARLPGKRGLMVGSSFFGAAGAQILRRKVGARLCRACGAAPL